MMTYDHLDLCMNLKEYWVSAVTSEDTHFKVNGDFYKINRRSREYECEHPPFEPMEPCKDMLGRGEDERK